jgi:RhtB (resistance to homoserine/threonine) family protein
MLLAFAPIALILTITPGAATAMVVRSTVRGGWRSGVATIAGNEVGVVVWALLSVLGISALIAASEIAFAVLKVVGAAVLIGLGVQSLLRSRRRAGTAPRSPVRPQRTRGTRRSFRDGLITSLANPKLAVFFVALFPQFVQHRDTALATTLVMASLIVAFDFAWYGAMSVAVSRAKRAVVESRFARWAERASGTILIAIGVRVAFEHR